MKIIRSLAIGATIITSISAKAQTTYNELEILTVNPEVTTVITASEPIRFVDISTDKVAGDQPIENTIRLKPKDDIHGDGDCVAIVTIVTERYRTQYALMYTSRLEEAVTDKEIAPDERIAYNNPAVTMSTADMFRYARMVWTSPARYRKVSNEAQKLKIRLNNIYTSGDYFFIDYSLENKTNIRFDIDQIRVKLADKKISKATNAQVIELKPDLILDERDSFLKGYRNVIVVKKMTFPNDKVLTLEISERQISGRTINLNIDYEDVLNADSFNNLLLKED